MAKSSIQDMSCMTFPSLSSMSLSGGMIVVVVSFLDLAVISFIEFFVDDLASMLLYTDDGRISRCRPHRKVMVRMKK